MKVRKTLVKRSMSRECKGDERGGTEGEMAEMNYICIWNCQFLNKNYIIIRTLYIKLQYIHTYFKIFLQI